MNQRLEEPEDSSGNHRGAGASTHAHPTPGSGGDETLGDARGKLAEALQSFSAAEAALPALQAALAAGRIPGKGDLADLERLRSALDGAARAVGIDPRLVSTRSPGPAAEPPSLPLSPERVSEPISRMLPYRRPRSAGSFLGRSERRRSGAHDHHEGRHRDFLQGLG